MNNPKNSRHYTRINNVEFSETIEQPENKNVNFINYNEQYNFEYDSSEDNYSAMVKTLNTFQMALQIKTLTIDKTDCHLLLDCGSGCTIIIIPRAKQIMFNCLQAKWSEKKKTN